MIGLNVQYFHYGKHFLIQLTLKLTYMDLIWHVIHKNQIDINKWYLFIVFMCNFICTIFSDTIMSILGKCCVMPLMPRAHFFSLEYLSHYICLGRNIQSQDECFQLKLSFVKVPFNTLYIRMGKLWMVFVGNISKFIICVVR